MNLILHVVLIVTIVTLFVHSGNYLQLYHRRFIGLLSVQRLYLLIVVLYVDSSAEIVRLAPRANINRFIKRERLIQRSVDPLQEDKWEISQEDNAENCRKFRLTALYNMALGWTKKEDFSFEERVSPLMLRNLNPCLKYWPGRPNLAQY